MSIDRAATLSQAEKLLRQGRLEQAIAEYARLVDEQPRDWNTANLLGDLHVRAGQVDAAVERFMQGADSLRREGFHSKASALYKKILKLRPEDDRALMRAGELAAEQGLLADARSFLALAADHRRTRGDARGALDIVVRLGTLDKLDVPARIAGARARHELGDRPGALRDLTELASSLVEVDREADAVAPLQEVLALDPNAMAARRELARILVAHGRHAEAAPLLPLDIVASDPALLLVAAEVRLRTGDTALGLEMVDTLLTGDDASWGAVARLAALLAATQPDAAFALVDRVASVRIAAGDWTGAMTVVRDFVGAVPGHVAALNRLIDVCVDGHLDEPLLEAQGLLADAYLAAGAAAQSRYVAEDLVSRRPWERAHYDRLRAALAAGGQGNPDRALADWLAETPAFGFDDEFRAEPASPSLAIDPGHVLEDSEPSRSAQAPRLEEDLSDAIDTIPPPAPPPVPVHPATSAPQDLDAVFARLRDDVAHGTPEEAAEADFARGAALLEAGQWGESTEPLRRAMRAPGRRFAAASLLSRAYQSLGRTAEAIEWLGHAVDVPGITPPERYDTLHRLADMLEASGEPESALAVCLELQADAGEFRDVTTRIARLSRTQAGG
ncbi:MAG: tetratricopeptide repeat protein [Vicinamibacterales bacterium]